MEVSVDASDVVRLMLQFCRENGLHASLAALADETGVALNTVDNLDAFLDAVRNGAWDSVLAQVAAMRLPTDLVADVYEHVVLELAEVRDTDTARAMLRECEPLLHVRRTAPQRYLHLERVLQRPFFDAREAYGLAGSKETRRSALADRLSKHVFVVPPARLVTLIGQAMRWQVSIGAQPVTGRYDVFRGTAPIAEVQDDAPPNALVKTVKFGKGVRPCAIAFAPNGQALVAGSSDGLIEVYDPESGVLRKDLAYQRDEAFMMHSDAVLALACSRDGTQLASGCQAGRVKVWDLASGKTLRKFDRVHPGGVGCLAFAPDATQLVSGGNDNTLRLLGMRSGNALRDFSGHTSYITSLAWLTAEAAGVDGVLSSSADGSLRFWDPRSAQCVAQVRPPQASAAIQVTVNSVHHLRGVPGPRSDEKAPVLLVCNRSATLFLMTLAGDLVRTIAAPASVDAGADVFVAACASPRAEFIYAVTEAGTLYCFATETGRLVHSMHVHDKEVLDLRQHPLRNVLASISHDATMRIWHRPS